MIMRNINKKKLLITAIVSLLIIIVMSVHASAQTYDYNGLKESIYRALVNFEDNLDVENARSILDRDHYFSGLPRGAR